MVTTVAAAFFSDDALCIVISDTFAHDKAICVCRYTRRGVLCSIKIASKFQFLIFNIQAWNMAKLKVLVNQSRTLLEFSFVPPSPPSSLANRVRMRAKDFHEKKLIQSPTVATGNQNSTRNYFYSMPVMIKIHSALFRVRKF